ncbi:MAG TPA: M20 family metallo-hydrolase [Treponemataceae bacterium]|nr:MAG: Succinyl-diaminopimelate desuccinylase [Spirochaetes bacterium ADurb.Bin269]TAH49693.1 MAG: M20 family metallo-hydrolase [Treponema sp.]HOC28663.1 M20 family metallo-hydrolase [Treponemataceae bacterium]HQL31821.1 M20 family metallo-hydrolase [Treponemataceae bacterium]
MKELDTLSAWIQSQVPAMIELQTRLTSIPALAPESGGEGELAKCEDLTLALREMGFSRFERYDAPDTRVSSGIRPNLVVTIPGKDDSRTLWFMAHLDVVPPGELAKWDTDPWKVVQKDGKLYGRGVEDNQQGLVASVFAALAFLKNGMVPAHTVKLLFVADEEVGSAYGIQYLLKNHSLFRPDDLIVIPDGGDDKGETIEVAEKNLLWLRFSTKGKQTHGSRPDQGANAHLAACDLALRLNALEQFFDRRDPLFEPDRSTFQPTKKEANVPNINTIPGDDVFCMDCRILPCYSLDSVRAEVARIAREVEQKHGVAVSWTEEQAVESRATPVDAPVVKALSQAVKTVYGVTARPIGIGGGTVGAYLRNAGFDAVVWSRMDETAHQPNEYCTLENLTGDAHVMAALMLGKQG